ncbi:MAG: cell division protein ZapA [Gammaproteobacteria bacterium]|jgi:cell division protein ZapA
MNESGKPVTVSILEKEYLISCDENEREQLHTAVTFLNTKMLDMKNSGRVIGSERIAVMTALNLAHELLAYKRENDDYTSSVDNTIQRLQSKIDEALIKGRQLEM